LKTKWILKLVVFAFSLVSYANDNLALSISQNSTLQDNKPQSENPITNTFLNKKAPISNQSINEVKKNQILLIIVVTFFVVGFLFLIYHLKKVRIINLQLENYANQNEFLIRETNHRVNNNLQLISLLITDTLRKKQTEENKNDFVKLLSKVETIASLHRHLYQSKTDDSIDLKHYLLEVKDNFMDLEQDKAIQITFDIDSIQSNSDNAMYIGLLITELIINSIKHAFVKNHEKVIQLKIKQQQDVVVFDYSDNGISAIDQEIRPKLVLQLCQQLKVNPTIETTKGFRLYFNLQNICLKY